MHLANELTLCRRKPASVSEGQVPLVRSITNKIKTKGVPDTLHLANELTGYRRKPASVSVSVSEGQVPLVRSITNKIKTKVALDTLHLADELMRYHLKPASVSEGHVRSSDRSQTRSKSKESPIPCIWQMNLCATAENPPAPARDTSARQIDHKKDQNQSSPRYRASGR